MGSIIEPSKLAGTPLYTRIRLAGPLDMLVIHKLIQQMSIFLKPPQHLHATEELLSSTLFNSPPFKSVTVFLLEVSTTTFPPTIEYSNHVFETMHKTFHVSTPIDDPEEAAFRVIGPIPTTDGSIAGYALFFPNYSTFLAKPGLYVEDVYVRECYRRCGLGRLLMKAVATQAVRMRYGRVDWSVQDWNVNAIRFYEMIGAHVLQDWHNYCLSGDALQSYGRADCY